MGGESDAVGSAIADAWLGVPRVLERGAAERLVSGLDALWRAQGEAAGAVDDRSIKKAWFDPLARGGRLRTALDSLPATAEVVPGELPAEFSPPLVMEVGQDRLVVTLEGRTLANLLRDQIEGSPTGSRVRLRWADTDSADSQLMAEYRAAAMAKLESVVRLRAGSAAPLLPQAIGGVLLLLLNGNIGPARGLRRPKSEDDRRAVDTAVASMVSDFAERIAPSRRGRTASAYSLYGGYAMTEARRRLGSDLTRNPISLTEGSRERVTERLITDLIRRGTTRQEAIDALELLIAEYEKRRPQLALYGLAQGGPSDTAALRRAFQRYDEVAVTDD